MGTETTEQSPIVRCTWGVGGDAKSADCEIRAVGPKIAMAVRRETGIPWAQWLLTFEDLTTVDIDSVAVLIYVARLQSGQDVTFDEVMDGLDYTSNVALERIDLQDSEAGEAFAGN